MNAAHRVLAVLLLAPAAAGAASRLLPLPVVADGVDAQAVADVQAALDAALAELPEIERVPPGGPTFCEATDPRCIADAGQRAGADHVLHVSARPVGGTVSLLLVLVSTRGAAARKVVEDLRPGAPHAPAVRAAIVRLVAPSRYVGALAVDAPAGSQIWVDGLRAGTAPSAPIGDLAPGQHLVRVVRPGGGESRAYAEVRFDETTRVALDEQALVTGPAVADAASGTSGAVRIVRVGLLAAGGVALVGALLAAGSAGSIRDEHERAAAGPVSDPAAARELVERYEARRDLASALLVGSGVLIAGSGVLFALDLLPAGGAGLAMRSSW